MTPVPLDALTAMSVILISSFAMDRVVTALLFLACKFVDGFPDPEKAAEADSLDVNRNYKLWYYGLAVILVSGALWATGTPRFMQAIGYDFAAGNQAGTASERGKLLDLIVTGIIIIGGGEHLAGVLKLTDKKTASALPKPPPPPPQPVSVTGTLTLDEKTLAALGKTVARRDG